jgi:hypothetical protein
MNIWSNIIKLPYHCIRRQTMIKNIYVFLKKGYMIKYDENTINNNIFVINESYF